MKLFALEKSTAGEWKLCPYFSWWCMFTVSIYRNAESILYTAENVVKGKNRDFKPFLMWRTGDGPDKLQKIGFAIGFTARREATRHAVSYLTFGREVSRWWHSTENFIPQITFYLENMVITWATPRQTKRLNRLSSTFS